MSHKVWIMLVVVASLVSGCQDFSYAIHREMTGLDCRPEVIREHNGQCAPVKAAKVAP